MSLRHTMIGQELTGPAPDLIQEVVGYREFRLAHDPRGGHNYVIRSPFTEEVWALPKKTARCNLDPRPTTKTDLVLPDIVWRRHEAPAEGCTCGLYAYHDPCPVRDDDLRYMPPSYYRRGARIMGLVTLTGHLQVHSDGVRAQRCEVRALSHNRFLDSGYYPGYAVALRAIAADWGIPLVSQQELPELAKEYGSPVPVEMRPGYVPPSPRAPVASPYEPTDESIPTVSDLMKPDPPRKKSRRPWRPR